MEQVMAKLLEDFEKGKIDRRQLLKNLAMTATAATVVGSTAQPAAAAPSAFTATAFNHVSYSVPDYKKARDFYVDLFGMKVSRDDGKQCRLTFGNNILIVRERPPFPLYDHIAYTLADWDKVKNNVIPELKKRGIKVEGKPEASFHLNDPFGYRVQFGGNEQ
ncbi:MAG: VOC family protein [Bryobacterales bacterium]|nr:VOC family protein [Bryobacterales bacterium]